MRVSEYSAFPFDRAGHFEIDDCVRTHRSQEDGRFDIDTGSDTADELGVLDPSGYPIAGRPTFGKGASSTTAVVASHVGNAGLLALRFRLAVKRAIDVAVAGLGLVALAPVLIAIAAAIRATSPGPVLFRQARVGLGGRRFMILKFRTMRVDLCDATGVAQTVAYDPRVTPIGRVLRRTNLDELPQLLNVLRGDMSLVGPRPHVPGMLAAGVPYDRLVPGYDARHRMRPGITGLAQVHGLRGPTVDPGPAIQRIARDLDYIRDFSLLLDLTILWRTLVTELRGGTGF